MPFKSEIQLLFIHIPKTGGTSIEEFFDLCHPENFWFDRWDRDHDGFILQHEHLTQSEYLHWEPQHYPLSLLKMLKPEVGAYFKFSFVRNPFTRILSEYFWRSNLVFSDEFRFDPIHFQRWLDLCFSEPHNSHKEPQMTFMDDSVDFIGKFENFESDFNKLLKMLMQRSHFFGKYSGKPIPRLNTTGYDKTELIPCMLRKSRERIVELYEQDFRRFGYHY